MASQALLGVELHWLEPSDVGGVEEHEAHNGLRLVSFEDAASQHDPLDDQLLRVGTATSPEATSSGPLSVSVNVSIRVGGNMTGA